MKKKFFLFFIYVALIIATLSAFIVLRVHSNKIDTQSQNVDQINNPNSNNDNSTNQTGTGEGNDNSGESEDQIVYAKNLTINASKTIQMRVGEHVKLLDGFLTVEPAEMLSEVEVSVRGRYTYLDDGISFSNNIITGNTLGQYDLIFKVKKSATTYAEDKIVVIVEQVNAPIELATDTLVRTNNYTVNEIFNLTDTTFTPSFQFDVGLNYNFETQMLQPNAVGEFNVFVFLKKSYYEYQYTFKINVRMENIYSIVISTYPAVCTNVQEENSNAICHVNFIEDLRLTFVYEVLDSNYEYASQLVSVVSAEPTIVEVHSFDQGLLKLNLKSLGSADITISLVNDPSVTMVLTVISE